MGGVSRKCTAQKMSAQPFEVMVQGHRLEVQRLDGRCAGDHSLRKLLISRKLVVDADTTVLGNFNLLASKFSKTKVTPPLRLRGFTLQMKPCNARTANG